MEEEKIQKRQVGLGKIILGIFLILVLIMAGNLKYILDWSTGELQGYNLVSVIIILVSIYLIVKGFYGRTKQS